MIDIANTIIPVPTSVCYSEGSLTLEGRVAIAVPEGHRELRDMASLFVASVEPLTGLAFQVIESDSGSIVLRESVGIDPEGYELDISSDGVEIAGSTPTGIFYGLQSLA